MTSAGLLPGDAQKAEWKKCTEDANFYQRQLRLLRRMGRRAFRRQGASALRERCLLRPSPVILALAMDRCEDQREAQRLCALRPAIQKRRDSLRTICRSSYRTRRRS